MNENFDHPISLLLSQIQTGDAKARERLFIVINDRLRALASNLMRNERKDHTLDATALVDEACLKLLSQGVVDNADNRRYLFAAAVRAMRQILVDHARGRMSAKRGGESKRHPLDAVVQTFETNHCASLIDLDQALERLEKESPRQREIIELRFFSGLTIQQTASLLDCSHGTVETDWRMARAKLYLWLKDE